MFHLLLAPPCPSSSCPRRAQVEHDGEVRAPSHTRSPGGSAASQKAVAPPPVVRYWYMHAHVASISF
jgi:hypothetical protein